MESGFFRNVNATINRTDATNPGNTCVYLGLKIADVVGWSGVNSESHILRERPELNTQLPLPVVKAVLLLSLCSLERASSADVCPVV